MTIYFFRHGDRESRRLVASSVEGSEPDLTPSGHRQAECLHAWVQQGQLPRPSQLMASPRRRAQNTLKQLSEGLSLPVKPLPELDERTDAESARDFRDRVSEFLRQVQQQSGVLFVCSHYDWLEELLTLAPADEDLVVDGSPLWAPGAFLGFEITEEIWHVKQKGILQSW